MHLMLLCVYRTRIAAFQLHTSVLTVVRTTVIALHTCASRYKPESRCADRESYLHLAEHGTK